MSRLFQPGPPIGIFRGYTPDPNHMEVDVVVPHGSALPDFGEFVLVGIASGRAAVGRVVHYHPTGPLASIPGEDYMAEIGRIGDSMPEEVRQLVLRYNMRLRLMGEVRESERGFSFTAGARTLAAVGGTVHSPSTDCLEYLCNVGLDPDDPSTVSFGFLVHADRVREDVEVRFNVDRLKSRRTFVFARAGYGKSNLVKYLLSQLYSAPPDVGLLIFDPEGEYALPQDVGGRTIPGLASLPALRQRLSLYTDRDVGPEFADVYKGGVQIDFGDFSPGMILAAFVPPEKHDNVWANWLKSTYDDRWKRLVTALADRRYGLPDADIEDYLNVKTWRDKEKGNVSVAAIKNNLIPPLIRLHRKDAPLGRQIISELRQGRIVVIDISTLDGESGLAIAGLLMEQVFINNVRQFTGSQQGGVVRTLAVLEEAQQILGGASMSERSVFVRWVKEGRKYSLGAILITQQPGAISPLILSQGDNFFVMHLLGQDDLTNLNRVNSHFSQDILNYIRNEPIKGNCYFWSAPDQPFVIPARVLNFDLVADRPGDEGTIDASLEEEVRRVVEEVDRLWVFSVKGREAVCFSKQYLSKHLRLDEELPGLDAVLRKLGWDPAAGSARLRAYGPERVVVAPVGTVRLKKRVRGNVEVRQG